MMNNDLTYSERLRHVPHGAWLARCGRVGAGRPSAMAPSLKSLAAIVCCLAGGVPTADAQTDRTSRASAIAMVYEGFTEPKHEIMVAAMELGRIESVEVEVGDHVQAGDVIGKLEDSLQAKSVELARMQAEMTGELDATEAEADLNRSRVTLLRELAADDMARPDELVRAETDLRVAVARHTAAIEQSEQRKIELQRYELQLERRKIRVPMDGVISDVFHQPGEYITPGDPAVVRLLVMDTLFAVFNIPVEDTAAFKVGSSVRIFLRSSSTTLDASISSVAPTIDGESGTVQVRVELDNPGGRLLAGDRCTLQLTHGGKEPRMKSTRREGSSRR